MTDKAWPLLREQCPVCRGTGESHEEQDDRCVLCNGTGRAPTQFGEEVIELVRDHLSAILSRILNDKV
jgi:RecJ-like exonuclease